jgi:ABC-type cobalamin transport system ATPase subunit
MARSVYDGLTKEQAMVLREFAAAHGRKWRSRLIAAWKAPTRAFHSVLRKLVEQMARAIQELKAQGVTVLLSEQNLYFSAIVADRAFIIEKGAIRYAGSMQDALDNATIRTTYLMV